MSPSTRRAEGSLPLNSTTSEYVRSASSGSFASTRTSPSSSAKVGVSRPRSRMRRPCAMASSRCPASTSSFTRRTSPAGSPGATSIAAFRCVSRSSGLAISASSPSSLAQSILSPKRATDTAAARRTSTVRRSTARARKRCASSSPAKCPRTMRAPSSLSMRSWMRSSKADWSRQSGSSQLARDASYCDTSSEDCVALRSRFCQRTIRSESGRLAASLQVASTRRTTIGAGGVAGATLLRASARSRSSIAWWCRAAGAGSLSPAGAPCARPAFGAGAGATGITSCADFPEMPPPPAPSCIPELRR